jgi:hypothetical protein
LTSCGIQWLAQVARYFSQAHLYLKGTNWLTSVWPLMIRLSAALTRRAAPVGAAVEADMTGLGVLMEAVVLNEDRSAKRSADGPLGGKLGIAGCNAGLDESFQDNIEISNV